MSTLKELEEEIKRLKTAADKTYQILISMDTGIKPMSDDVRSKFIKLERHWQAQEALVDEAKFKKRVIEGLV